MKVTDYSNADYDLDKDGKLKKADSIKESAKKEWSDCIVKTEVKGANSPEPPNNVGGGVKTKAEIMKITDTAERQAELAKLIQNERNND